MIGNLLFFLGGKMAEDGYKWRLNLTAIQAAIKFVISIGRLDTI
jgi:hypothetical protein